jgi:hypothetical protein
MSTAPLPGARKAKASVRACEGLGSSYHFLRLESDAHAAAGARKDALLTTHEHFVTILAVCTAICGACMLGYEAQNTVRREGIVGTRRK